jgi:hypothetical protein
MGVIGGDVGHGSLVKEKKLFRSFVERKETLSFLYVKQYYSTGEEIARALIHNENRR